MSTLSVLSFVLSFIFVLLVPISGTHAAGPATTVGATPVIVELFTSEGCSSCPPADALLAQLGKQQVVAGADVLVLGEHVDYWNHLGWSDRFSSAAFTERQETYARRFGLGSAYTPQMVIDGRFETVGSDSRSVEGYIEQASREGKMARVSVEWNDKNILGVAVDNAGSDPAAVLLAVTEDSLTSKVESGENGGRVLRHSGVVRQLKLLGNTAEGKFVGTVPVSTQASWKADDLRVIVFVQKPGEREIVGAAQIRYR